MKNNQSERKGIEMLHETAVSELNFLEKTKDLILDPAIGFDDLKFFVLSLRQINDKITLLKRTKNFTK